MAWVPDADDGRATKEGASHALDCRGHRCAEHLRDAVLPMSSLGLKLLLHHGLLVHGLHVGRRDCQQDATYVILKPKIYHLVRLIDHDIRALIEDCVPLVQCITQPTRCGEGTLYTLSQCERLLLSISPTNNADHAARNKLSELARFFFDLKHELSAGRKNDRVRPILRCSIVQGGQLLHVIEDGQHVSTSLSTACFSNCDEIAMLTSNRDDLHLDWCGLDVTDLVNCF
mmetsp:Transcript_90783/g.236484  ORF Transcript_90783/g.236484 Transcript_90783/m.236484 type:complete len:229 (+) Transcript_90783:689-1375(+)